MLPPCPAPLLFVSAQQARPRPAAVCACPAGVPLAASDVLPAALRRRCIMGLLLLVVLAIVALVVVKVTNVADTLPGVSSLQVCGWHVCAWFLPARASCAALLGPDLQRAALLQARKLL